MGIQSSFVNRRAATRLALLATLLAAGCTNPIDQRGNLPPPDKLAQITPGTTDKATVTQLLGSPSSTAAFDGDTWYYISQKTQPVAVFGTKIVDQQVLAIEFDDKGIVRDLVHRTMADGEQVALNPHSTPAPGREFTVLEQLIGNFGKFTGNDKEGGNNTSSGH